ncbi:hypothetical protein PCK2_000151 [Pneumocystis canis]|nr:hypothetical protein PCK2_000151 [Pneumocystis canis]
MKYLFISFIFSILALIDATDILFPRKDDKLTPGKHTFRWKTSMDGINEVDLYIHRDRENPPFYHLLGRGIRYKDGSKSVHLPSKLPPGNGYSFLLTSKNPYNVHAKSDDFSLLYNSDVKNPNCYEYLVDDGSSTPGPKPDETSLLPEPTTGVPEPTETPDCDECEECDDEVCGDCLENDVCNISECTMSTHEPGSTTAESDDKTDVTNLGSINKMTGFLLVLITISSILFL